MSYKKRVIIFLSIMAVVFIALGALFVINAKDNLNNLNKAEVIPKEAENSIKSTFDNLFEFENGE